MTTSAGLEEELGGRNISTTHVTLGSTRLMRNIGMMGEAVLD